MTDKIIEKLKTSEYSFLYENTNLNTNIILLGLGGSYSYGTNIDTSDIDIRGVATNTRRNIFLFNDFEHYVDKNTDTTIYSFDKFLKLLCKCNPASIELLGLRKEDYIHVSILGSMLLKYTKWFLSCNAIKSYGGYIMSMTKTLNYGNNLTAEQISKQMMHIVRLYYTVFDILEKKEINTYRTAEHDLLMDIRKGNYIDNNNKPSADYNELINQLEKRFVYDKNNTDLPSAVDIKKINALQVYINEKVCYQSFNDK